jgi:hypothetical protein
MNWIKFFTSFFEDKKEPINRILDAGGCRECWLQGEIYLHAEQEVLATNTSPQKFDLSSDKYPMVAEIKICGGDYQPKMKGLIEADVRKLESDPQNREKYMILVVDTRGADTPLREWLMTCKFGDDPPSQIQSTNFVARIWKVGQHTRA